MKRKAAIIKFRVDATEAEIARALSSIKAVLELPRCGYEYEKKPGGGLVMKEVSFRWSQIVNNYDDEYGEPVFYIP